MNADRYWLWFLAGREHCLPAVKQMDMIISNLQSAVICPLVRVLGSNSAKDGAERQGPEHARQGVDSNFQDYMRPVEQSENCHRGEYVEGQPNAEDQQGKPLPCPVCQFHSLHRL